MRSEDDLLDERVESSTSGDGSEPAGDIIGDETGDLVVGHHCLLALLAFLVLR